MERVEASSPVTGSGVVPPKLMVAFAYPINSDAENEKVVELPSWWKYQRLVRGFTTKRAMSPIPLNVATVVVWASGTRALSMVVLLFTYARYSRPPKYSATPHVAQPSEEERPGNVMAPRFVTTPLGIAMS